MAKWIVGIVVAVSLLVGCQDQSSNQGVDREPTVIDMGRTPAQAPGQPVQPKSAVIWVKGLSCPLCVQAIKKELQAVKGVEQIDVNYQEEFATVLLSSRKPPSRDQIVQAVERSGYVLTKVEMK